MFINLNCFVALSLWLVLRGLWLFACGLRVGCAVDDSLCLIATQLLNDLW